MIAATYSDNNSNNIIKLHRNRVGVDEKIGGGGLGRVPRNRSRGRVDTCK